jgi:hypothetical protein
MKQSRRTFIKKAGLTSLSATPIGLLLDNIVQGLISKAMAEAAGVTPRKFLFIQNSGAPSRWMWDLLLSPYDGNFNPDNSYMGTRYVAQNGRYTNISYELVAHTLKSGEQIYLPHMWQFDVPKAKGGLRPMTDLVNNMLHIRGIHGVDGHDPARALQFMPPGSAVSTTAVSADYSDAPIPAINVECNNYSMVSEKKLSSIQLGGGDLLKKLVDPFVRNNSVEFEKQRQALNDHIMAALTKLNTYARSGNPGAEALRSSSNSAIDLIESSFADIDKTWQQLVAKYNDLITRSDYPNLTMEGINDLPIGDANPQARGKTYDANDNNIIRHTDVRDMWPAANSYIQMANHFAVAEYVLLSGLSDSVAINPLSGYVLRSAVNSDGKKINIPLDHHTTGAMIYLFPFTHMYAAVSACMLEMIDQLKANGIFNDTVIGIGGEFNRSPRNDGGGCDHGHEAISIAYYSGCIPGPIVLGNTKNDSRPGRTGKWGTGAGIDSLGGKPIDLGYLVSSLATLIRVPNPNPTRTSLLREEKGKILSNIEKAKEV